MQWQELPPPGGYGSAQYKKLVVSANLPALLDGDHLLADSEAINEYLNEAYPGFPLLSDDIFERSKQREIGRFHDTRLEPDQRATYPHIPPNIPDRAFMNVQSKQISTRLSQLGTLLRLTENRQFSLGDCGYPGTFAWLDAITPVLGLNIIWPESVIYYRNWLESQAAVKSELSILVPAIETWLSSR